MISIVIPVFNEAQGLEKSLTIILQTLTQVDDKYQVLFVNDGSKDNTKAVLEQLCKNNNNIDYISFSRNFGKEAAIHAGLSRAQGDAVIVMDSDLQHPPTLIPEMIKGWKSGFKVVHAVKKNRGNETFFSRLFAKIFYTFFELMSGFNLNGQSDFKLLDRTVVDSYLALTERNRFFRAIITWYGYPSMNLPFEVQERLVGTSQFNFIKLLKYALNNIVIFSSLPLKWISYIGFAVILFGISLGAKTIWDKFSGHGLDGFTTINLLTIIIGGSILFSIGIIGHYLALIYDEIKHRPSFVIETDKVKNP